MFHHKICASAMLIIAWFFISGASAEYVEGVDTTDVNGYGPDSVFRVTPNRGIEGNWIVKYYERSASGYFNYTFDEIKMAPKNPMFVKMLEILTKYCFVVKKTDSTYMKVQIQEELGDGQYVYKFGYNTSPNDRLLEKIEYDRSVKYKPNNLYYNYWYDSLWWDPPLQNYNNLIGYVFYLSKKTTIDTTVPIKLSEWDSIVITDTSKRFVGRISAELKYWRFRQNGGQHSEIIFT